MEMIKYESKLIYYLLKTENNLKKKSPINCIREKQNKPSSSANLNSKWETNIIKNRKHEIEEDNVNPNISNRIFPITPLHLYAIETSKAKSHWHSNLSDKSF